MPRPRLRHCRLSAGDGRGPQCFCHRHRRRQPARLERSRRVQPFVFYVEAAESDPLAEAPGVNQRRHPFAKCDRRRPWKDFFVAPHRVHACAQRFETERPPADSQVVAGEQRRLASGAEVLQRRMRHDVAARCSRTLEMRECRGHEGLSLSGGVLTGGTADHGSWCASTIRAF